MGTGNTAYSSQDGVLYNKNKTTLFRYPQGKTGSTFNIPNSVTTISGSAFFRCRHLTSVTIPSTVTSIARVAFLQCSSLTSVTIPGSVTSIGDLAFFQTSLTSVTFATGSNISDANFGNNAFPEGVEFEGIGTAGGNALKTAYNNATTKAGTYIRSANGITWSKQ